MTTEGRTTESRQAFRRTTEDPPKEGVDLTHIMWWGILKKQNIVVENGVVKAI